MKLLSWTEIIFSRWPAVLGYRKVSDVQGMQALQPIAISKIVSCEVQTYGLM